MIYSFLDANVKLLNAFIDAPLTLLVGREKITNNNNDLGDEVLGATYITLIQPVTFIGSFKADFIVSKYNVNMFFGQLYKRSENATNTNEFHDSGVNELKILDETEQLVKEFLYKIRKDVTVKEITNVRAEQLMDYGDTCHTGHKLSFTIEFLYPECFGQLEPTPEPEPEIPEPLT